MMPLPISYQTALRPGHRFLLAALLVSAIATPAQARFKLEDLWGNGQSTPARRGNHQPPDLAAYPLAQGFRACPQHFPHGDLALPFVPHAKKLCFGGFGVLYDPVRKAPVAAVERLEADRVLAARMRQRSEDFFEEPRLPARERASLRDFQGTGWDRGHMAPAGDMPDQASLRESFSLANMVPQNPEHNRKSWSKIESDVRKYVSRTRHTVFVYTGPLYTSQPRSIGRGVAVPDVIWKVVFDASEGRAWAIWAPNSSEPLINPRIGYDEFLRRGGPDVLRGSGVTAR